MKKLITLILSAAMLMPSLFVPSIVISAMAETTYQIKDNLDKFKINGRYISTSEGAQCDWSGSGIEFSANCSGDVKVTLGYTGRTDIYFTAYVDGNRVNERFQSTNNRSGTTWTIATGLSSGNHTFRIAKQSSGAATNTLTSVTLTGTLNSKPENRSGYIEVIGDSISCGVGNLGSYSTSNGFEATDATQSYGFLAADSLNSDVSIIALGGIGIRGSYIGVKMGEVYPYASYYRSSSTAYLFSRKPNVVVINLGTNDVGVYGSINDNETQTKAERQAAFISDFKSLSKELINTVRSNYPNVPIVWAYNMMNNGNFAGTDVIGEIISELGGSSANIYKLQLTRGTSGGGGHPLVSAHVTSAQTLVNFISSKGWISGGTSEITTTATSQATTTSKSTTTTATAATTTTTTQSTSVATDSNPSTEKVEILTFDTTGRNYTDCWGQATGWTGGTSNGNGANMKNGLVSSSNGNLIISTGDEGANMIQQQLWGDQSSNAQKVYKAALAAMGTSTTGKKYEFMITNNADNTAKFGFKIYTPGDIGTFDYNTTDTQFEIAPGESKTITLDLPEGKTFPTTVTSDGTTTDGYLSFEFNAVCAAWNQGKINFEVSPIYLVGEGGSIATTTTVATTTTTTTKATTTTTTKNDDSTLGDLNRDGSINIFDLLIMKRIVGSPDSEYAQDYKTVADLNKDNAVNISDLLIMKKLVARA